MSNETLGPSEDGIKLKRPRDSYFLDAYIGLTMGVCALLFSGIWYNERLAFIFSIFALSALSSFLRAGKTRASRLWTAVLLFSGGAMLLFLVPIVNREPHGHATAILTLAALAAGIPLGIFLRALMAARKFVVIALITIPPLAVMTLVLFGYGPIWMDTLDHPYVDRPLPELALSTFDGQHIEPANWRGHVVVLSFWATWCGPCKTEMPELAALQQHYRGDPRVVILAIDGGVADDDTAEKAQAYLQKHEPELPGVLWTGDSDSWVRTALRYGGGIPSVMVIDKNQRVRVISGGYNPRAQFSKKMIKIIDGLLRD